MTDQLTDRVALITGSDSGIGQATAVEFAKEGADVVVTYLDDDSGARGGRMSPFTTYRRATSGKLIAPR